MTATFDNRVALIEMAKHAHRALNAASLFIDTVESDPPEGDESAAALSLRCARIASSLFTLAHPGDTLHAYDSIQRPSVLAAVIEHLDGKDGNGPGHAHEKAGVWDADNGEKAGSPCEWCATWRSFKALAKLAEG